MKDDKHEKLDNYNYRKYMPSYLQQLQLTLDTCSKDIFKFRALEG